MSVSNDMSRKTSSSPPPAPRTQLGLSASLRRLGISTNLRKAERQGRHDHKVDIDDDGSTPWTSAEFERCHEAEMIISAELRDVIAPIDSRLAVDAERLRQLRELMAAPRPEPGAPPPDRLTAYRERRAAREEAARARQRRADLQEIINRMTTDLATRRHLLEQSTDLVNQVAAVGNARVSAYRRGLVRGPWWRRLFGRPRRVTAPVPVYQPRSEWLIDLPLLRTRVVDTPEVLVWAWEAFRETGGGAPRPRDGFRTAIS